MSGLNIIKGHHAEGVDVTLLARTRFADNSIITTDDQPDATANAFTISVFDMSSDTPRTEVGYANTGDKAAGVGANPIAVSSTTLLNDGFWDVDNTGYNILLIVPFNATTGASGVNWLPTHTYRVIADIVTDGTGGAGLGPVKVVWEFSIDAVDP